MTIKEIALPNVGLFVPFVVVNQIVRVVEAKMKIALLKSAVQRRDLIIAFYVKSSPVMKGCSKIFA